MGRPDLTRVLTPCRAATIQLDAQLPPDGGSPACQSAGVRLVCNSAFNVGGQAVIVALVLLATPYLIHRLGVELYGSFILLLSYIEIFSWLDFGITSSLTKYIAEQLPTPRTDEINRFVGTALTIVLVLAMVIAGGIGLWAHVLITHRLDVPDALRQTVTIGLWIASITFVVRFIGHVTATVPVAAQRFDLVNAVAIGTETFRIVGSVVVVYFGFLLEAVMLVTLMAAVASGLANMMVARHVVAGLSWWPVFSRQHVRAIVSFSKYVVIANTSARILHSMDKVLIGYFLPAASVAFYAVPYSLSQRVGTLAGNITSTVFPAASAFATQPGDGRLHELYLRSSKIVAACVCFPALVICLLSREILTHWIDLEFADHATIPLQILSVAFLLNCLSYIPYVFSQATGQPLIAARFCGLNAILTILLCVTLIPSFGIVGAAMAFLFSQVMIIPCFVHAINRGLRIGWLLYCSRLGPVAFASTLGCLLVLILRPWTVDLLSLGLTISVVLVVYMALVAMLILDQKEQAACWTVLNRILRFDVRRLAVRGAGYKS